MTNIVAIYGSPRRKGNTATLVKAAVAGARASGARVEEFFLRDMRISPCLEIYGCKKTGKCVIKDDFQRIQDALLKADGLILGSPIFFYSVSAHTKALIDRHQSLWVKKYWLGGDIDPNRALPRKGLFISVGATHGRKLFDGVLLTIRYFFDTLDMSLWRSLLYRGIDFEGDVQKHPQCLLDAQTAGKELVSALCAPDEIPSV